MSRQVDNKDRQYLVSRKVASELLNLSVRTLDRYVKAGKLSTIEDDGRKWLDKRDLEAFISAKAVDRVDSDVDLVSTAVSTKIVVDKVDNIKSDCLGSGDIVSTKNTIDQEVFMEMKEELKEKQERLEIANYRVGQLECQVRNSMPMLEYHRESYQNKAREDKLRNEVSESHILVTNLRNKVLALSLTKKVFVWLLLFILALQPLWIYFIYN